MDDRYGLKRERLFADSCSIAQMSQVSGFGLVADQSTVLDEDRVIDTIELPEMKNDPRVGHTGEFDVLNNLITDAEMRKAFREYRSRFFTGTTKDNTVLDEDRAIDTIELPEGLKKR